MLPLGQTISPSQLGAWQQEWAGLMRASDEQIRNYRVHGRYLDPFDVPVLIESPIIAIVANCAVARQTWSSAGTLLRVESFPGLDDVLDEDGQALKVSVLDRCQIRLNSDFEIFSFNGSTADLKLTFIPRPWIPEIGMVIYSYKGVVNDPILAGIEHIKGKLDAIDSQVGA